MHITPIFGAICLKKRLAEKNSATKVIDLAQEQNRTKMDLKIQRGAGRVKLRKKR